MRATHIIFLLSLVWGSAFAQTVRLPLEGYFRPGEYMPVNIEAAGRTTLQTDGVMNTRASRSGVVPMFTMSATADRLKTGEQSIPIHALQPDERLVGFVGRVDAAIAQQIFPEAKVVSISLDSADPLPGPGVAWSSLDAVVLDVLPKDVDELLAAGIAIFIHSGAQPDAVHSWGQLHDGWMLSANLFPPHPALLGEDAYLPTQSWEPQMSAPLQKLIVLIAVLIGCLMLATLLVRARWRLPALAVVAVISSVGILVWKNHQPAAMELIGGISHDRWTYETSSRATEITMPLDGVIYPVFGSASHAANSHALLDADREAISCELPANGTMAFVRRTIGMPPTSTQSDAEQFLPLARRAYLAPGETLHIENNRIVIDPIAH